MPPPVRDEYDDEDRPRGRHVAYDEDGYEVTQNDKSMGMLAHLLEVARA